MPGSLTQNVWSQTPEGAKPNFLPSKPQGLKVIFFVDAPGPKEVPSSFRFQDHPLEGEMTAIVQMQDLQDLRMLRSSLWMPSEPEPKCLLASHILVQAPRASTKKITFSS